MKITLDERLSACANFVRENSVLADVGTDHAYLPAFLISNGKIKSALACDVNEKPLESAKQTVIDAGVVDKVTLRLCDGLCGVKKDEFTDLVVAGMGGELIIKILSDCPYIKSEKFNLVLQPMSKVYDFRKWLCENGFLIIDEKAAVANNKVYTVINAKFVGGNTQKDEVFYHFGKLLDKTDEKAKLYIEKQKKSLVKRAKGILSSNAQDLEALEILAMLEKID